MSWLNLATCGFRASPVRTLLTWLSIGATFALFGVLEGVDQSFDNTIARLETFSNRLLVANKVSRNDQLPLTHLDRLHGLQGVAIATQSVSFRGLHRGEYVGGYAVDPSRHFRVYSEYQIGPEPVLKMQQSRTAAIIGRKLAEKYGWQVGSKIPLQSGWQREDGSPTWSFDIVGIYDTADSTDAENLFINYEYLDGVRVFAKGTATDLIVRVAQGVNPESVGLLIDSQFANSAHETLTQNDGDLARARMRRLGDIDLFVSAVVGCSISMLLLLTINVMRQSVEERSTEFATLGALGFAPRQVYSLVIAECCILIVGGAVFGLIAASWIIRLLPPQLGQVTVPWQTVVSAILCALALAFASALAPLARFRRLTISEVWAAGA